jgi:hypothetical protein
MIYLYSVPHPPHGLSSLTYWTQAIAQYTSAFLCALIQPVKKGSLQPARSQGRLKHSVSVLNL